jgi:hypothetical protein
MRTLTKREKMLLLFLGGLVLVIVVVYIIMPSMNDSNGKSTPANDPAANLLKIEQLNEEYRKIRQDKTQIMSLLDAKNENTATLIQQYASSCSLDKNIAYTKRTQSNIHNSFVRITTDVKIEGAPIQQLLKFISNFESGNDLTRIQFLRITKGLKGTDTYDALIKIDTYTNK